MRRTIASLGIVLFLVQSLSAQTQTTPVKEFWHAAYLEGQKCGFFHITVQEFNQDGRTYLRTSLELNLAIKRYKDLVKMGVITGTEETPGGRVTAVSFRQFTDKAEQLHLTGTVEGKQLHLKDSHGDIDRKVDWNEDVIGLHRQYQIYQERQVKPGDRFSYYTYEPLFWGRLSYGVNGQGRGEVEMLGTKKKLLRVEVVSDKIEIQGKSIQLPSMVLWLDKNRQPLSHPE